MPPPVKIVFGAGTIGSRDDPMVSHTTPDAAQRVLNIVRKHGYTDIDISRAYSPHAPGTSEPLVGQTDYKEWALIDTKVAPNPGYEHTPEGIAKSIHDSLTALKTDKVNILYLHWPDRNNSFEAAHKAMDEHYKAGKFNYFGLSNYEPSEVETFMRQSEEHGWVKPTYYQGHYNAVQQTLVPGLLPVLRKHKIALYAYSPAAGGYFGKQFRMTSDSMVGGMYQGLYGASALPKVLAKLKEASEKEGISPHALALRWVLFHSVLDGALGDGIVIGARSDEQLEGTLKACKEGRLPKAVAELVDQCWKELEPETPYFSVFPLPDH